MPTWVIVIILLLLLPLIFKTIKTVFKVGGIIIVGFIIYKLVTSIM